eukprot:TRINITY_DN8086_c0_g1_i1.p1 TRINITY_DN8086_c0_g1~~TRINITY_DN8086_c0_g1_i1.p1  ORF type:complete len:416 (+),score=75.80 TRINITY_DN8086_c0_g1_i1:108-1355(+)
MESNVGEKERDSAVVVTETEQKPDDLPQKQEEDQKEPDITLQRRHTESPAVKTAENHSPSRQTLASPERNRVSSMAANTNHSYLSYFDPKIFLTPSEVLKSLDVHLVFTVHGIGARLDILNSNLIRFGDVIEQVKLARPGLFSALVHLKMLNWKSTLSPATRESIERATLKNNPWKREIVNTVPSDLIFYLVPEHSQEIKRNVVAQANSYYQYARSLFPRLRVSILAHSLGSVIIYDILRSSLVDTPGSENLRFNFPIEHVFNTGSPLGLFCSIREQGSVTLLDQVGVVKGLYNIFHPQDLIAYRLETMIPEFPQADPFVLPYYINDAYRKHKEKAGKLFTACEKTKKKYGEEIGTTFKRYDFELQEKELENVFETFGIIKGHFSYWENKDLAYFVLRRLHDMRYSAFIKEDAPK